MKYTLILFISFIMTCVCTVAAAGDFVCGTDGCIEQTGQVYRVTGNNKTRSGLLIVEWREASPLLIPDDIRNDKKSGKQKKRMPLLLDPRKKKSLLK